MKKILTFIGILIGAIILIGGVIYFFFPQVLIDLTNSQNAKAANLVKKVTTLDGYEVNYFTSKTSDKTETVVLLHGMGDDKNSFVQSAKELAQHYNLILPDLSGHGENAKDTDRNYSIGGQVNFLHALMAQLNISSFHLAGNSMGGHTSAAYAIKHSDQVKSLILVNAPGVKLDDHVVYTGFGAPLESQEDLQKILDRVFYKAPSLPGPIAKVMIKQVNGSIDFVNNNLVSAIKNGKYFDLKGEVDSIKSPTLILWGKHDEVVKFNVAEYFDTHIPLSEIQLLENGSHSPQLEVPQKVGNAIHNFIKKSK